jgi:hypothetical protein
VPRSTPLIAPKVSHLAAATTGTAFCCSAALRSIHRRRSSSRSACEWPPTLRMAKPGTTRRCRRRGVGRPDDGFSGGDPPDGSSPTAISRGRIPARYAW